jgi:hypothetical protein
VYIIISCTTGSTRFDTLSQAVIVNRICALIKPLEVIELNPAARPSPTISDCICSLSAYFTVSCHVVDSKHDGTSSTATPVVLDLVGITISQYLCLIKVEKIGMQPNVATAMWLISYVVGVSV